MPLWLRDPLWAGLVWRLGAFFFCLFVWLGVRNENRRHDWWIRVLSIFRLANEDDDNEDTMIMSRLIFKWSAVLLLIVLLYHSWLIFRRTFPNVFGPPPIEGQAAPLPQMQPGAGGAGNVGGAAPPADADLSDDPGALPDRPDPGASGAPAGGGGAVRGPGVGPGGPVGGGGYVGGQNQPLPGSGGPPTGGAQPGMPAAPPGAPTTP